MIDIVFIGIIVILAAAVIYLQAKAKGVQTGGSVFATELASLRADFARFERAVIGWLSPTPAPVTPTNPAAPVTSVVEASPTPATSPADSGGTDPVAVLAALDAKIAAGIDAQIKKDAVLRALQAAVLAPG
jgi:hypothetical protein